MSKRNQKSTAELLREETIRRNQEFLESINRPEFWDTKEAAVFLSEQRERELLVNQNIDAPKSISSVKSRAQPKKKSLPSNDRLPE